MLLQLLAAREEQATQRVWLHSEREREEEARGRVLEARARALQHQKRIKELLLRTDPQLAPGDLRGAWVSVCVCVCGVHWHQWLNGNVLPSLAFANIHPTKSNQSNQSPITAGVAHLTRETHLATVDAVHEAVALQREGYEALAMEYAQVGE